MKLVLVYNPKSGSNLSVKELRAKCKENNITILELVPLSASTKTVLMPYIKNGQTIATIGGDGTISYIAGMVAGTRATLAPLPGGTFNHFTKDLKIPQNIDKAFARLVSAKRRTIDVASINETIFVNNASFGIYPSSLKVREGLEDSLGKWPAAVVGVLSAWMRFRIYTVTINGRTIRTPFVFVGNNDYHIGDVGIMNRTNLDQGRLSVAVVKTATRRHTLWIGIKVMFGMSDRLKEFDAIITDRLTIQSKRRTLHVSHDGELANMTIPLQFEIRKRSLTIL